MCYEGMKRLYSTPIRYTIYGHGKTRGIAVCTFDVVVLILNTFKYYIFCIFFFSSSFCCVECGHNVAYCLFGSTLSGMYKRQIEPQAYATNMFEFTAKFCTSISLLFSFGCPKTSECRLMYNVCVCCAADTERVRVLQDSLNP